MKPDNNRNILFSLPGLIVLRIIFEYVPFCVSACYSLASVGGNSLVYYMRICGCICKIDSHICILEDVDCGGYLCFLF